MLVITRQIQIPEEELTFTFARSSGPGGQNVNKVNSKCLLHWWPARCAHLPADVRERFLQQNAGRLTGDGELLITSQKFRDQGRNVSDCLEKLQALLQTAATPPIPRKKTRPTRASQHRRREDKQQQSAKKQSRRPPRRTGDD